MYMAERYLGSVLIDEAEQFFIFLCLLGMLIN